MMVEKQFSSIFYKGLGSAIMELISCDTPDKYKDIVLYGCTHNTTYDMQVEGNRGIYLYQAINLVGDIKFFEDAIIDKYNQTGQDLWLFDQLTSLLFT